MKLSQQRAAADAAAEAACVRATQAEEAAWRVHWANAPAEGQARRAAEELHRQRTIQRAEAEMLELTPRERRRLANLNRREFWGARATAALVLPALVAAPTAPAGSRASDFE
jgi:hypothetical protein